MLYSLFLLFLRDTVVLKSHTDHISPIKQSEREQAVITELHTDRPTTAKQRIMRQYVDLHRNKTENIA